MALIPDVNNQRVFLNKFWLYQNHNLDQFSNVLPSKSGPSLWFSGSRPTSVLFSSKSSSLMYETFPGTPGKPFTLMKDSFIGLATEKGLDSSPQNRMKYFYQKRFTSMKWVDQVQKAKSLAILYLYRVPSLQLVCMTPLLAPLVLLKVKTRVVGIHSVLWPKFQSWQLVVPKKCKTSKQSNYQALQLLMDLQSS